MSSEDPLDARDEHFREALDPPKVVTGVVVEPDGTVSIGFADEGSLQIVPSPAGIDHEEIEDWRFFSPGSRRPHLVRRSTGFDLDR
jgi:hypothetical protein